MSDSRNTPERDERTEDPSGRNPNEHRLNPMIPLACAVVGMSAGVLIQLWRTRSGLPTLVLPYSITASMLVLAAVLLVLGIRIRRALTGKKKHPINPFSAVRLLAAARAGQCVGALLGGGSAGLLFIVLLRPVAAPTNIWLPTTAALLGGIILTTSGMVTEQLCKIPPTDDDENGEGESSASGGRPVTHLSRNEPDPHHIQNPDHNTRSR